MVRAQEMREREFIALKVGRYMILKTYHISFSFEARKARYSFV